MVCDATLQSLQVGAYIIYMLSCLGLGYEMKQWYALYVLLYSFIIFGIYL